MHVALDDYAVGAAVATDLVNTAPAVQVSTGEALPDAAALARFLADHGLQPDALASGPPTAADVAAVHRLRAAVRAALDEPATVLARAAALTARAGAGPALDADHRWYVPSVPAADLVGELGLLVGVGLLGVVRALGDDRFRQCAAPGCAGAFVDTSRGGRRRYCEPEVCGNRVNVARYRARRRGR